MADTSADCTTTSPPAAPRPRFESPTLNSVGRSAWAVVGITLVAAGAIYGLAAISTLVLPLVFAAVFAILAQPMQRWLLDRRIPPGLAAGLIVFAIAATIIGVIALTARGLIEQYDRIADEVESALTHFDIDNADIEAIRNQLQNLGSGLGSGAAGSVAAGFSAVGRTLVGVLLGGLIFYYFLKDGSRIRRGAVNRAAADQQAHLNAFIEDTFFVFRRYWLGRAIISAVVAAVVGIGAAILNLPLITTIVVVTFVGGFIPYLGALIGGALTVVVALGSNGIVSAIVMLGVVMVANIVIENLVEPAVTGKTLQIHPLVVLLSTTLGATVAGIPGMIMAVPIVVIAQRAVPVYRTVVLGHPFVDVPLDLDPLDDEPQKRP
ncbi:MAG: AI-2E family transporter [Microthrixaceae bacterium]|nr:AI-2E family transporter [Microthrixaceae bacterium]MCO5313299.1 AI-2E family transporter [Microthrixaceae bacterium]